MRVWALLTIGISLLACSADAEDAHGPAAGTSGAEADAVRFSEIFDRILVGTGCNAPSLCHGGGAGLLFMNDAASTRAALVGIDAMGESFAGGEPLNCRDSGRKRVVAGSPDQSLLVEKLEGTAPCGLSMPPIGPRLSADQIQQIRSWIAQGAE